MKKIGPRTLDRYGARILNIHPALLPFFGGQGMYGKRVHQAVLASGAQETGVTIHLVDPLYDHGPIVAQCRVSIRPDDTVDSLARRVLEYEHVILVETVAKVASGEIDLSELWRQ
jgi:phosphoribosylglycinamide formyltransferase-1